MNAGELVIKTSLDTKDFTMQIEEVESKLNDLEATYQMLSEEDPYVGQEQELKEIATEIEKTKNKLVGLYKQQNKINQQGFKKLSTSIKDIGKGIGGIVKKVGKWALAIFAIRSIYTGIRQVISQVSQYNEQVKTDLDYMKYAVAMALTPVVEYLVKLFYAMLQNVRNIIESLTGFNIFAKSGAKGFKEANKQAKELKKTTAGFDKLNILSENKSGEKEVDPSYDLSKKNDIAVKGVGKTIDKLKEMVSGFYSKLKENAEKILGEIGFSKKVIDSVKRMMSGVELVIKGALDVIGGLIDMAIGLLTGNTDMFVKGFIRLVEGIKDVLWGMLKTQLNLYQTIGLYIFDLLKKLWDDVKDIVIGILNVMFLPIKAVLMGIGEAVDVVKLAFEKLKESAEKVATGIKNAFIKVWDTIKTLFNKGGKIFEGIKSGISSVFKDMVNKLIEGINKVISEPLKKVNELMNGIRNKLPVLKLVYDKNPVPIPKIPKLAKGGIVNNPGAGVMMGNYIAGEKGPEAVIPLDEKTIDALGMAFARNAKIGVNLTNEINGRLLARVLKEINNDASFATNGGSLW